MRGMHYKTYIAMALLVIVAPLLAQQSPINPKAVALLRWYPANLTTSFPAYTSGITFDGENIWLTASNGVTKLRASDGANLGTFSWGGYSGGGVAFDGANIWVANNPDPLLLSAGVTKLRASDGTNLGMFWLPGAGDAIARGVAFDGANVWVVWADNEHPRTSVTKLRASDGAVLGGFVTGGSYAGGLVFDGTYVWVTSQGFTSGFVFAVRASDGAPLGTFRTGQRPTGITYDGTNIWVANSGSNTVTKLRASDGTNLGTFAVGNNPNAAAFDGANIWVANHGDGTVSKLRALDVTNLGTFAVGGNPNAVAFDGANIWVTNRGAGRFPRCSCKEQCAAHRCSEPSHLKSGHSRIKLLPRSDASWGDATPRLRSVAFAGRCIRLNLCQAVPRQRRRAGTNSVPARPCLGADHGAVSGLQAESEPSGE